MRPLWRTVFSGRLQSNAPNEQRLRKDLRISHWKRSSVRKRWGIMIQCWCTRFQSPCRHIRTNPATHAKSCVMKNYIRDDFMQKTPTWERAALLRRAAAQRLLDGL